MRVQPDVDTGWLGHIKKTSGRAMSNLKELQVGVPEAGCDFFSTKKNHYLANEMFYLWCG